MKGLRPLLSASLLLLSMAAARGVESDPLPVPENSGRAAAVRAYNDGVALLVARNFKEAQQKFEAALAIDDKLAEAHNNLAFSLRMQGRHNFDASLAHYDRAIALKPGLAQAYMYRGVLFVQQGNLPRARQDLDQLRKLDPKLAAELERVVDGSVSGSERSGVAGQYE
jgi:tetratricopeptide (TPR) repeat protein